MFRVLEASYICVFRFISDWIILRFCNF